MSRWLLGSPDTALVFLQFGYVPETILFYSISHYHWSLYLSSHVHSLIPLLWNFDQIASILEVYWHSLTGPDGDEADGDEDVSCSVHRRLCARLYRRYEYLVGRCQPEYMSCHLNLQMLESPLKTWTEHEVASTIGESGFFDSLHDDLLQSHFLVILRGMGLDRHIPQMFWVWNLFSDSSDALV